MTNSFHIWAIGDLHLSFGVKDKSMDVFGPAWKDHADQIAFHWRELVASQDLVLIPGDISWAMRPEEALPDLQWIDRLPGTKVMIRGNHDYWWGSLKKLTEMLPPSLHVIQNNAFHWRDVAIGGTRLWDSPEYNFSAVTTHQENPRAHTQAPEELVQEEFSEKIFGRELERLKLSLRAMSPHASLRIAMTHYPPIGLELKLSRAAQILEQYKVHVCVFGHLHNLKEGPPLFGEKNGVKYFLTSCDFLRFKPLLIF